MRKERRRDKRGEESKKREGSDEKRKEKGRGMKKMINERKEEREDKRS